MPQQTHQGQLPLPARAKKWNVALPARAKKWNATAARGVAWGVRRSVDRGGEGLVRAQCICPANVGRGGGGGPNDDHGGGISVGAGRGDEVRV